jgi:DNA mismatch endonuclease (patch repair protein)
MTDVFPKEVRSRIMSRIHSRDTLPELSVRSMVHRLGFRFRLHVRKLPGTPDLVLPRLQSVIFVHGCFWHGHPNCDRGKRPTSNTGFWRQKITRNRARDKKSQLLLRKSGWRVCVVWQCELDDKVRLIAKLSEFLSIGQAAHA